MDIVGCISVDRVGSGVSSQPLQHAADVVIGKCAKSTAELPFVFCVFVANAPLSLCETSVMYCLCAFRFFEWFRHCTMCCFPSTCSSAAVRYSRFCLHCLDLHDTRFELRQRLIRKIFELLVCFNGLDRSRSKLPSGVLSFFLTRRRRINNGRNFQEPVCWCVILVV